MGGWVSANSLAIHSWRRNGSVAAVLAVIPGRQTARSSAYDIKKRRGEDAVFLWQKFQYRFWPWELRKIMYHWQRRKMCSEDCAWVWERSMAARKLLAAMAAKSCRWGAATLLLRKCLVAAADGRCLSGTSSRPTRWHLLRSWPQRPDSGGNRRRPCWPSLIRWRVVPLSASSWVHTELRWKEKRHCWWPSL